MKNLMVLSILFLIGCAENVQTDKEFVSLITKFEQDFKSFKGFEIKVTTSVVFGNTKDLGECRINNENNTRIIWINKSKWVHLLPAEKESLIFHELGHCELNYVHRDDVKILNNGYELKTSIMHSSSRQTLRDTNPSNVNEFYYAEFFHNDLTVWNNFNE